MTDIDWGKEERRLAEQYAQMDEDELQALANRGYELTEVARRALQAEISRRGLAIKLRDEPAPPLAPTDESEDPMESPLVTISHAYDLAEARRLQAILDAAGILYCWGPDNQENIDAFHASFDNGLDLKVTNYDLSRAVHALNEASPPDPDEPEEPDYVPVCPKCHSPEIVFLSRDPGTATGSRLDAKFNWSCDACGNQWKDDGIEEEAPAS